MFARWNEVGLQILLSVGKGEESMLGWPSHGRREVGPSSGLEVSHSWN